MQYYCCVLQSTNAVLLCTTKYYSSTTLYYKALQCKTLYHRVLLQYYSVLQPYYSNARSNSTHPPMSPNTRPATQNDCHDWSCSHMKRHLQCAEQQAAPSNLTKYCACHTKYTPKSKRNLTLRGRFEHCMIRAWSDHELVISHWPVLRGYFSRFGDAFCIENYNISRSGRINHENRFSWQAQYLVKLEGDSCCSAHVNDVSYVMRINHETYFAWQAQYLLKLEADFVAPRNGNDVSYVSRINQECYFVVESSTGLVLCSIRKVTLQHHQMLCLPQKVTLQNHQMLRLPRKMTLQHHQILRLPRKVTLQHHQMLRLLRRKTLQHHHEKWHSNFTKYCTCHKNWLCVTWLSRYLAELLLYWAVTLLTCYFTELLLYWAVTLLNSLHV